MLSLNECKKILEEYDYHLEDEEIIQLRDFLSRLARAQLNNEIRVRKDEKSDIILPSEQRRAS